MYENNKKFFAICIICFIILAVFTLVGVTGSNIKGVEDINEDCTVTVRAYKHGNYDKGTDYVLEGEQIQQFKELMEGSNFLKVLSGEPEVDAEYDDRYDITVDFGNGQETLSINCTDNLYIKIPGQYNDKYLKVVNKEWESTLENIIY